jgi:DNA-binding NarL/FixJ family response regulator
MTAADALQRGRESFERRGWGEAYASLSFADRERSLEVEDLERLATAAYLVGRDDDSTHAWERAHQRCLRAGDAVRAARCAFWLAFGLLNRGEVARGGGWLARARRLIDEGAHDCVELGYIAMPAAIEIYAAGDPATAYARFARVTAIAGRFGDRDLLALGRTGQGRSLLQLGQIAEGMALLDEVMVAVTAGEVAPILVGATYCSVLDACREIFDLRRAREWTAALSRWCDAQPDLVPYRGQCLVYRAEIMQLHGDWSEAEEEARRACEWLARSPDPHTGQAFYRRAELHRLRGEYAEAEQAYRRASRFGRTPQPGLALLRLARGQIEAAATAIRLTVSEAQDSLGRANVLAAHAEIMLATGDVPAARAAADELTAVAADLDAPLLRAVAANATGAVCLAEGDARAAVDALRRAWTIWQELDAPYEAARVRVLRGLAYRALGDHDTAAMELDAARRVFRHLGATPDALRTEVLARDSAPRTAGGLTTREVEVLRLVAAGMTNRAIAADLVLSERTVDRHVSNILTRLGLPSRAAAAAYAVEHHLA